MKPVKDPSLCSRNRSRTVTSIVLSFLAGPYWGCGGGSSSPSSPSAMTAATPQPCTQDVLFQGTGTIPAGLVQTLPLAADVPFRLDVTLDWTFSSNPVGLYVAQGECTLTQFNARSCNFLLRLEPGAKPQKGSANVVPGVTLNVMLSNFGTRDDAGALQIVRSVGSCPPVAASAGATAASAIAPRAAGLQDLRF